MYDRIEAIGYKLVIDDKAKEFIAGKGYDVQYGARPLKRAIQTYLEDGLSELINRENVFCCNPNITFLHNTYIF